MIPNARCYIVGPVRSQAYYEKILAYISEKGYAKQIILTGTDYPGRSLVCDYEGRVIEDAGVFEGGLEWVFDAVDGACLVGEMRERWGLTL